ncbi:hypothetical protein [Bdellovibrio sp. HCB337]|uniref:hypothetical protein n=1 Tax=Bdellovibrio sp. HCB337 TaxID=3394358 RepID=UPI0039A452BC
MNLIQLMFLFPIVFLLSFQEASAAPFSFNVDGVITDASGNPLEANPVTFQIDVKNSAETCILYRETFSVDMTGSNGYFSIVLGKQTNAIAGGSTLEKVFSNQGANIPGLSCTYTPGATSDTRKIVISFNDGSTSQTFSTQEVQSVPFALESVQSSKVGDYASSDLLKAATSVSKTTYPNSALNQAQYDEFWRLITNPMAAYLPTTGDVTIVSGNNKVTTIMGQALPAGPATNGQVLVSNGTSWTLQSMSSGSVTSVGGTSPINIGGTASAPTVSIQQANTTQGGYLSSTDWNTFNAKQSSALANGSVWIGNGSGVAEAHGISGDATLSNSGVLVLASTITAGGPVGTSAYVPVITYDAKGRLTAVTSAAVNDTSKLPLSGGTMGGVLNMGGNDITATGNITMGSNKYFTLSNNGTDGTAAGQMWYNAGVIKYYDGSTVKTLSAGSGISSLNGLSTATQNFALDSAGADAAINSAGSTHTLSLPSSSATNRGLLTNTDWAAFNAKQSNALANSSIWIGNASGGAQAHLMTGDATISNTGNITVDKTQTAVASKILQLDAGSVATTKGVNINGTTSGTVGIRTQAAAGAYTLTLPADDGSTNQFLQTDGSGNLTWAAQSSALPSLTATNIWVGNASGGPEARVLGGDIASVSNTGSVTVNKTTTGTANTILSLDGNSVGNMRGLEVQTGTGKATIQTSGAFTDYILTLPADNGNTDQVLKTDGNGILSWATVLTAVTNTAGLANGKIWIGDGSGKAQEFALSGDATMSNTGALTLASTITAGGPVGTAGYVPVITYDAKGRLTAVTSAAVNDASKLPLAGGTMSGDILMGGNKITGMTNVPNVAANPAIGQNGQSLRWNNGTSSWEWFTASAAGAGITSLNSQSGNSQSFGAIDLGTSVTAPAWSSASDVHTLKIPMASDTGVTAGLLSKTDHTSFSNKLTSPLTTKGDLLSRDASNHVRLPVGSDGQVLSADSSQASGLKWVAAATGTVTSIATNNGLTGGTITGSGTIGLANITNNTVLANTSGANGIPVATTVPTLLDIVGNTQGNILYRNGSTWTALPAGTAGYVLQTGGAGANPSWAAIPAATITNTSALGDGKLWVGNSSGKAQEVSITGDATMSNTGALTLASTITAGGPVGTSGYVPVITYDAKGRLTAVTSAAVNDASKLPLAGGNLSGTVQMNAQNELRFADSDSSNYVGFRAPTTISTNVTWTLPNSIGGTGQVLTHTGSGVLNWTTPAASLPSLTGSQIWVGNSSNGPEARVLGGDIASVSDTGSVTVVKTTTAEINKILALNGSGVGTMKGLEVQTGTGKATIQTSGAFTDYILTLPADNGNTDQVLKTDGNGILSWATVLTGVSNTAPLTNSTIWVGNSSGKAVEVSINGDATMSNSGQLTLASTITAGGPVGTSAYVPVITYDAKGRLTAVTSAAVNDTSKLPLSGGTMGGVLNMGNNNITAAGNIAMGTNKYFTLSNNSTDGTAAGQMWFDGTNIKFYDGGAVRTLGVAGAGITSFNGSSATSQSLMAPGTTGTAPNWATNTGSGQHTLHIPMASASGSVTAGLISNSEYATLVAKQSNSLADSRIWVGNSAGGAQAQLMAGDATISNTGNITVDKTQTAVASKILQLDASSVAVTKGVNFNGSTSGTVGIRALAAAGAYTLTLPNTAGTAGQFLQTTGGGTLAWTSALTSVNTKAPLASGKIWVGNASGVAMEVDTTGDATIYSNGVITLNSSITTDINSRLPKAGGSMTGAIAMGGNDITAAGNISMNNNKYLGLPATSTAGTVAGQMWYESGTGMIKYYDGTVTRTLGISGASISSLGGQTGVSQGFAYNSSGNSPAWSSASDTHTFSIPMANAGGSVTAGLISNADYVTFNAKQSTALPSGQIWVGNASGIAQARGMTGDATISNSGVLTLSPSVTNSINAKLPLAGGSMSGAIFMGNNSIYDVNSMTIIGGASAIGPTTGALVVTGGIGSSGSIHTGMGVFASSTIFSNTEMRAPIFYGSNAASGTITLDSTSHATKGNIIVGPGAGTVTMGTSTPELSFTLGSGGASPLNDGSFLAKGPDAPGTGRDIATTGTGVRMIWSTKKAAFRAGNVNGTQWDNVNIGTGSMGLGYNTQASGSSSVAMGYATSAFSIYSTAMGANTLANGTGSTAMGSATTATGNYSTSMGNNTTSNAMAQTTIGQFNIITGSESASTWVGSDPLFVVGNGTSAGAKSNAMTVLKRGDVLIGGHIGSTSSTGVTVTGCGTGATVAGTDTRGKVSVGTGSNLICQVVFANPYNTPPVCVVSWASGAITTAIGTGTITTTTLNVNFGAGGVTSVNFNYICME